LAVLFFFLLFILTDAPPMEPNPKTLAQILWNVKRLRFEKGHVSSILMKLKKIVFILTRFSQMLH
jgi:hypothetical protein